MRETEPARDDRDAEPAELAWERGTSYCNVVSPQILPARPEPERLAARGRLPTDSDERTGVIERVLAWSGTDRFEYCHVWEQPGRLSARGTILTGDYRADYELDTGPGYEPKRLRAQVTAAGVTRLVRLRRDIEGDWWVRDGIDPRPFTDVAGIDLDLSPFLVALPLQRLPLHEQLGRQSVTVATVSLPDLTVRRQVQTLTHLRRGAVRATVGAFSTDLEVDGDGYVIEYPGVATRIRAEADAATEVG